MDVKLEILHLLILGFLTGIEWSFNWAQIFTIAASIMAFAYYLLMYIKEKKRD